MRADWTPDELVLALDLYLKNRHNLPDEKHPDVKRLSDLLRAASPHLATNPSFRNPAGVAKKLANFSFNDPEKDGYGLPAGNMLEPVLLSTFVDQPVWLKRVVRAVKQRVRA